MRDDETSSRFVLISAASEEGNRLTLTLRESEERKTRQRINPIFAVENWLSRKGGAFSMGLAVQIYAHTYFLKGRTGKDAGASFALFCLSFESFKVKNVTAFT